MNYTDTEKSRINDLISSLPIEGKFKMSLSSDSDGNEGVDLVSSFSNKTFKIAGCFPFLFCSSNRHVLLENKEYATAFLQQEKFSLDSVKIASLVVDFDCSSLKIKTDIFSITFFPNMMWGWGIQYEGENFIVEAIEFGGIEVRP